MIVCHVESGIVSALRERVRECEKKNESIFTMSPYACRRSFPSTELLSVVSLDSDSQNTAGQQNGEAWCTAGAVVTHSYTLPVLFTNKDTCHYTTHRQQRIYGAMDTCMHKIDPSPC